MPYYCFNICNKSNLPALEQLASELGLKKADTNAMPIQWLGNVFKKRKVKFEQRLQVTYYPNHLVACKKAPLLVETFSEPMTHKNKEVREVIRRFMAIANPTEIRYLLHPTPIDLAEFTEEYWQGRK